MTKDKAQITSGFWRERQVINAQAAIFHQWEELERSGCIDNFRILAEDKPVFRRGWFFADSDAYKWLEAASMILRDFPLAVLEELVDEFINLLSRAQEDDGYLYTFNQIHFPGQRWVNLQIEHELYCHGHLIEAGVSRCQATGERDLLVIARKAADRIIADFARKGPRYTPGHEEIEIALLRLYEITQQARYLDQARQFLEQRGKTGLFGVTLFKEFLSNARRLKAVEQDRQAFDNAGSEGTANTLQPVNTAKKPPLIQARWLANALSGKYFQQHKPLDQQRVPVGHAVRFAYLQTAGAMLSRLDPQADLTVSLAQCWQHLVTKRMYLTGGIGSLPVIEGFGRDDELNPEYAYAETCAALGCLFWNREMASLTGEAQYSDLYEWQLYNAVLVGMGLSGTDYFYNNPLKADGSVVRQPWYEIPCCPSNLSRTLVSLGDDILAVVGDVIRVRQYISSKHQLDNGVLSLVIDSQLPWHGRVDINFEQVPERSFILKLRQPSWATGIDIRLTGTGLESIREPLHTTQDPQRSKWISIKRDWQVGDRLTIGFDLPVQIYQMPKTVQSTRGMGALSCGPLVYCLESVDNPDVDIFEAVLDPASVTSEFDQSLLGGARVIHAASAAGDPLLFIPYHLWGNRGPSQMSVFVHIIK